MNIKKYSDLGYVPLVPEYMYNGVRAHLQMIMMMCSLRNSKISNLLEEERHVR